MVGLLAVLSAFLVAETTEVEEDVDGGALGGAINVSGSGHHRSWKRRGRRASWGCCRYFRQRSPPKLKTLMVGPKGGAGWILKAATTEDEEDVDDGPPEGCCRYFQQRPPPKLKMSMADLLGVLAEVRQQPPPKMKKTSMAGLLVVLAESLTATTIEDEEDIDDGSPGGCCRYFR
jgi:hypothetical protein